MSLRGIAQLHEVIARAARGLGKTFTVTLTLPLPCKDYDEGKISLTTLVFSVVEDSMLQESCRNTVAREDAAGPSRRLYPKILELVNS